MKTKFYSLLLSGIFPLMFAQVGINTTTPAATLDVNGNMKIRLTPAAPTMAGHQLLAVNNGSFEVVQMDPAMIATAGATNTTVYAAKKTAGISLLSLGLFPSGFQAVNFLAAERTVGASSLFSDTDHTYTIPTNGVYEIGFDFRYGTGLRAELLANSPGIAIVRTRAGVATIIDSKTFSGVNLLVANLTVSEAHVNSLYTLQAGDKISFGTVGSSVLNAGVLGSSSGSFHVYKVSN